EFDVLHHRLCNLAPEAESFLNDLDTRYYKYEEDLYARLHTYAAAHADEFRGPEEIEVLVRERKREREEAERRRVEAIKALEREWFRKERPCPGCGTRFTSLRNRGRCPTCRHVFLASHPDNPDAYPYGGEWNLYKP